VLFTIGNLLGVLVVAWGNVQLARKAIPNIYDEAGMTKVPHGVALHALQLLPLLAWWLARAGVPEPTRLARVRLALAGYLMVLGLMLAQTLAGRGPLDLHPAAALVGLGGLTLTALAARPPRDGELRALPTPS
jgi:hypothetical protein